MKKKHPTIGCCGIDCGLCPRFYTEGSSRCPGCGGEGFELVRPPCSFKTCCADKHSLEACGGCAEYPCAKYENREKIGRDSFVTHERMFYNHEQIKKHGIDSFTAKQSKRVSLLENMLADFDAGRSKSYYCLAATLLPVESLEAAIAEASSEKDIKGKAKALKAVLRKYAEAEGVVLALIK